VTGGDHNFPSLNVFTSITGEHIFIWKKYNMSWHPHFNINYTMPS